MASTTTNALTGHPVAVANFNNRAYFAVGNTVQFTDVLSLTRTAGTQSLTLGDSANVIALAGLPVQTTSSGVVSALTAFKTTQIWQVTGDPTTTNLAENYISLTVGTQSPRTIAQSPSGLYFVSKGGPYFIDPLGTLRALTNNYTSAEPDLQIPFINAVTPTRWAGYYNDSIYRVCGPTVVLGIQQTNDYWFDEHRRRWSGPHTFAYDCASAGTDFFILTTASVNGLLLSSQSSPQLDSVYNDLGAPYQCVVESCQLPAVGDMATHQVTQSQIELGGSPLGAAYTISAIDEVGSTMNAITLTVPPSNVPLWGDGSLWGSGVLWTSGKATAPVPYAVNWTSPLVFEKMQLSIQVTANASVQIGKFYALYQRTGYMTTRLPA